MFIRSWIGLSFIHEAKVLLRLPSCLGPTVAIRFTQNMLHASWLLYSVRSGIFNTQSDKIQSQCSQQVDTVSNSTTMKGNGQLSDTAFSFTCQTNYVCMQYSNATVLFVFSRDWLFKECLWSDQYHFVVEWFERWLERKHSPLKWCCSELQLRMEDAEYLLTY